ncbi:MAG: AAA family ATPase, partial [Clostridia bacterium]
MAHISLYRRYRPDTFDKLIGQKHIVKTLVNQINSGNISHAYLFTGTRGTGKTSVARIFAKAINCLNPLNGSPCGKCECCNELSNPNNMDIIEIDAASNNTVDEIRDLREKVKYPPVIGKYKVYIIDEVHMMTTSAFNA